MSLRSFPPVIFQLFSRITCMYPVNGKTSIISTVVVVCLAFEAIMKYQVEQLNKIRVAATAIGIDEEVVKNWKVQDCMQLQLMTSVHLLILFSIY